MLSPCSSFAVAMRIASIHTPSAFTLHGRVSTSTNSRGRWVSRCNLGTKSRFLSCSLLVGISCTVGSIPYVGEYMNYQMSVEGENFSPSHFRQLGRFPPPNLADYQGIRVLSGQPTSTSERKGISIHHGTTRRKHRERHV